jgi:hypothetical protein
MSVRVVKMKGQLADGCNAPRITRGGCAQRLSLRPRSTIGVSTVFIQRGLTVKGSNLSPDVCNVLARTQQGNLPLQECRGQNACCLLRNTSVRNASIKTNEIYLRRRESAPPAP